MMCLVREFLLSVLAPSKGLVSSECLASSQGALMTSYTDCILRGAGEIVGCREMMEDIRKNDRHQ